MYCRIVEDNSRMRLAIAPRAELRATASTGRPKNEAVSHD